jgi:hypothetical protein
VIRDPVAIARADVIEVARQLSLVVVSLDRIGSAFPHDELQRARATEEFIKDWDVLRRLAAARKLLFVALDEGLTEEESLREEEQFELPAWSMESPEPPQ